MSQYADSPALAGGAVIIGVQHVVDLSEAIVWTLAVPAERTGAVAVAGRVVEAPIPVHLAHLYTIHGTLFRICTRLLCL